MGISILAWLSSRDGVEGQYGYENIWKMAQMIFFFAQMKYNLVAQMKYRIFQILAQMQYARLLHT
jgi:hypothetical protein